ncbi:GTP-binding protein yptV5 [Tritrichomonas foetus]|uniref:GTP-binding protein yptV5 n=1 Tax=Tritrichomonas foetus TaxID=1144522 RepID=A0A1J4JZI9_9EUKA|nr:GTP-binding protein yptV5 [Tritrichomonas foetus]|eukprot:OHT04098.1 GTP-binding protein yptV5 [Tritrichomonas foetus]
MSNHNTTRSCKLTILGDSSVGKTTLIHSFVNDEFRADFKATLGTDLSNKYITVDDQQIQTMIWDTAGTERFQSVGQQFYRGSEACILVADLTNIETFKHLEKWRDALISVVPDEDIAHFPFVIFANKADLVESREVSPEQVKSFGQKFGCETFEVSAKNGQNVELGFITVLRKYLENLRVISIPIYNSPSVDINSGQKNNSCC